MLPVVTTIETKCKRCYSCIRNCPAKAISVKDGQAHVLTERCIACGYCVKVCAQNAKKIRDGIDHTEMLLSESVPTFAILAPSFPAAFHEVKPGQVITALKKLGFDQVMEVAFGADLVADEYAKIVNEGVMPITITSPCPVIVNYIEKYYPDLCLYLAPVVSPMIALGRVIRAKFQPDAKIVFIGPCIAKKREIEDVKTGNVIDEVLTFDELRRMFTSHDIDISSQEIGEMDGPQAGLGRAFPVSGGLLKAAAMKGDILENDIVTTEGRERVLEIIEKVYEGKVEARFLDLLFCEGCINGPKMANDISVFVRKDKIINYLKNRSAVESDTKAKSDAKLCEDVNLRRGFTRENLSSPDPDENVIREILSRTGKFSPEDELNCGSCGYPTCREKAIAVYLGLAEAEMCLPYMIEKLNTIQDELKISNQELRTSLEMLRKTQKQLVQSEKLASVGQLAAGVAHELNNPLGGIMIFANLLLEQAKKESTSRDDLARIIAETERCRSIVRGLLDFSRQTRLETAITDLNAIISSTLALLTQQALFHDIEVVKHLNPDIPKVCVDVGLMQQVLLNIILNAAEAMAGKGRLTITTDRCGDDKICVTIEDNGAGMSREVASKIFDPFFTTKPQGKGTGLGLAIAYGIVQSHKGSISVESKKGLGSTFVITMPTNPEIKQPEFAIHESNLSKP